MKLEAPAVLEVTVIGSGTSSGVPQIGCDCAVCTSTDPRNRRLRPSLRLTFAAPGGQQAVILVDTSTDLRQQALRHGIHRLDAILFTHAHADHVFGLDDVRSYNFRQGAAIPCFGSEETLGRIRRTFAYIFEAGQEGGGKPSLDLFAVREPFDLLGLRVLPIPVFHGSLEVFGYRIGTFAYVTDCSRIPDSSFGLLRGVETLILDALRYRPHPTHFSVEEALEAAERIGAKRTFLTHINHEIDHGNPQVPLPPGVEFGYDGLRFEVS